MNNSLENQNISHPLTVDSSQVLIGTLQEDYPLTEVELMRIKEGRPKLVDAMVTTFGALVGYAIPLSSKFIDYGVHSITRGEVNIVIAGLSLIAILFGVSLFLPNERKKTLKKIKLHFDGAKKSRHIIQRSEQ